MTTLCPIGCGRIVKTGHLMCVLCWRMVPSALQREVYRTWRAWQHDMADADRMAAYRSARDAAIASVP